MTTRPWKFLFLILVLILAVPAAMNAQGPRSGFFPWWDSPMVSGLDLTNAQRTEIRAVIEEYRGRMVDVRNAVQKAEGDLDAVFNEDAVDQQRGSGAIDRLTKARADMTKSVSEMSLRMRAVLTAQQWQELQRRQREQGARIENAGRGPGPGGGPGRGHRMAKAPPKDAPKDSPSKTAENQVQATKPGLSQ
jgi:Spy/CpxP family protein refolding chaperone